ncbi:transcription factor UPBEAT1 [Vicia villosa]|uniref:transcription factor UPBEAT1 n=1 Tax=Vicia villosa TaxID=3911 RepID=UPI00273A94B8|nr:transcription factor UPBEAT1 [Vicia villosa]
MGVSSQTSFDAITLEEALQGSNNSSYLWSKKRVKRSRRIFMKRRVGCRRGSYGIQRRVRTLKRLIPNSDESIGLEGLFRETANYILSLENRVRVMKVMVEVLNGSDE